MRSSKAFSLVGRFIFFLVWGEVPVCRRMVVSWTLLRQASAKLVFLVVSGRKRITEVIT